MALGLDPKSIAFSTLETMTDWSLGRHARAHSESPRDHQTAQLSGREREIAALRAALAEIGLVAQSRLVVLSGNPGIGKSSIVYAFRDDLAATEALFASGKFDQYARDVPYATLAQAMESLVSNVQDGSLGDFESWQSALRRAVNPYGHLIASVVPSIQAIIGPQPEISDPSPRNQALRSHRIFAQFLQAFARKERPLVLFLDDLQWADAATLAFVEFLFIEPQLEHFLLVGAYRADEVVTGDALSCMLQRLRKADRHIAEIGLQALGKEAIGDLVKNVLQCDGAQAQALGQLLHDKTLGNPLFAQQFLTELTSAGHLAFDPVRATWTWDALQIAAMAQTGTLLDLLLGRLDRLPMGSHRLLQHMACLGMRATIEDAAMAAHSDVHHVRAAMQAPLDCGLVIQINEEFAFVHDRVREAAYSQLAPPERARNHLHIGRWMLARSSPEQQIHLAFDIVDQLSRGIAAITQQQERERAAELSLLAARRAKASTAYTSALSYLSTGISLLDSQTWANNFVLAFELHLAHAECAFLAGHSDIAEQVLGRLLPQAQTPLARAAVHRLLVVLHVVRSDYPTAVDLALQSLAEFGIHMDAHPSREQLDAAFSDVEEQLQGRPIESLIDLPLASDTAMETVTGLLSELFAPACFTDERLGMLHLCHMVRLTLQHGVVGASAQGIAWFGVMLGHQHGRHADGHRYADVAYAMVKRHQFTGYEAKSLFAREIVGGWTSPLETAIALSRSAFRCAVERSDVAVACFSCHHTVNDMLVRGDNLEAVQRAIEEGLVFVRNAGFRDVTDELVTQHRFVLALRGRTAALPDWTGLDFDEERFEAELVGSRMPTMIFWYWLLKAQLMFLAGLPAQSQLALKRAEEWTWSSPVHIQYSNFPLFMALTLAALEPMGGDPKRQQRRRIDTCRAQIAAWHDNQPATFADKLALLDAEIARLDARPSDAGQLYQRAVDLARSNGFTQIEAIASELAARFYAHQGLGTVSEAYLYGAHQAYSKWGAGAKVAQLEQAFPILRPAAPQSQDDAGERTYRPPDLAAMVTVAQSLSGEIRRDRLVATFLKVCMETAAAHEGALLLPHEGEWQVDAFANLDGDGVTVTPVGAVEARPCPVPQAMLQYVIRTQKRVLLDNETDALMLAVPGRQHGAAPGSMLCLPLVRQGSLAGILCLQNKDQPGAFSPQLLTVLELLASQAAISLENARLYANLERENRERRFAERESARVQLALQESEARFRRMADNTPDCIWITDLVPERVIYASPSFERIWGRKVDDLYQEPRLWVEAIHPEDRGRIEADFGQWIRSGSGEPWSAQFRIARPDGTVRWIHDRGVLISEGRKQRVSGISTDVTDQVAAQAALRESEERYALVVSGSNDGIWDLDVVSGRLFMSERSQKLFGIDVSVLPDRSHWAPNLHMHPDDTEQQTRLVSDCIAGLRPAYEGEWRARQADGIYRWIRVRGVCVRDTSGRATRFAGSVGDIDVQRRVEAALQQAQRLEAIGTLAGGIAHDFNNILGAILGFGDMARRSTRTGSRARRDIEYMLTAGERGRSLIERLLTFSGTGHAARVPVNVESVVREALTLVAASIGSVRIELSLTTGTAAILGDATQLHQVVMNLATNAVQAMPHGGVLSVTLTQAFLGKSIAATTGTVAAGEYLVLEVSDSGNGMTPDIVKRIFDPFFTTKEVGSGTGLGLSLVHGIVSEFGGAIAVSTLAGKGSRFTVYLPRVGDAGQPATSSDALPPRRGAHEQILLVDDEELLVRLMTHTLAQLGYVPVGFTSPNEAVAAFAAHPERFDAVITDERMPGMSGAELIKALRKIRPSLPSILVSGYVGQPEVDRARAAGADAVLSKPIDNNALAEALTRLLPSSGLLTAAASLDAA